MVTVDVMVMMATYARGPVWVDREAQLAVDAEEEHERGEAMFDAAAGHCNEYVGRVGGEIAGEEVKVFVFMSKDMAVKLCSDDGCRMFFCWPCVLWGKSVVRKY